MIFESPWWMPRWLERLLRRVRARTADELHSASVDAAFHGDLSESQRLSEQARAAGYVEAPRQKRRSPRRSKR